MYGGPCNSTRTVYGLPSTEERFSKSIGLGKSENTGEQGEKEKRAFMFVGCARGGTERTYRPAKLVKPKHGPVWSSCPGGGNNVLNVLWLRISFIRALRLKVEPNLKRRILIG